MIADTNPIRSAWACKFEKLDSRGHDNNVPCSPLGPQGTSQVEPRAHVSNSSPCSITCFWQPCQQRLSPRQTAFRLVHEENHEDRCKRAQIKPKAVDLGTPRMEPTRGGAAADLA